MVDCEQSLRSTYGGDERCFVVFGRIGSSLIEALLPSAQAQACTEAFCEHQDGKGHRCCKICTGGAKVCGPWSGAGTGGCSGVVCHN